MIKIIIFLLLYVPLESIAADDEEVKVSIAQYRGGRDAAISYTFDDGLLEQYTLVFPELEKRNIKATFAVNGGWMAHDCIPCIRNFRFRFFSQFKFSVFNICVCKHNILLVH